MTSQVTPVIVTPIFPPARHGGVGVVVEAVSDGLSALGLQPVVVVGGPEATTASGTAKIFPVTTGVWTCSADYQAAQEPVEDAITSVLATATQQPVLHCQDYFYFPACEAAAARFGVPLVTTFHFSKAEELARGAEATPFGLMKAEAQGRAYTNSDIAVFVSDALAMAYRSNHGPRDGLSMTVHNPTCCPVPPLPPARPSRGRQHVITAVGRLVAEKNFGDLVQAAGLLRDAGELNFRVDIYGGGRDHAHLSALVESLGVQNIVTLRGELRREQLLSTYRSSDVLAVTSPFEPFGLVCVEAMAHGVPVVAYYDSGGPAELIVDGYNGRLCRAGPESLASTLFELLTDEVSQRDIREAAYTRVREQHDSASFVNNIVGVYHLSLTSNPVFSKGAV